MPLDLSKKLKRNKEIFDQLWRKKQGGPLTVGQRTELKQTIRAIRSNRRAIDNHVTVIDWLKKARKKSRRDNKILGIPGYYSRDYKK